MKQKIDLYMWLKSIKAVDKSVLLVHVIFITLFYLMNVFTPFNGDDYRYAFIYGSENYEKISSLSDVITSQIYHYNHVNGRFVPHFLEQAFMGIWGKPLFNVLNSVVFLIFAYLVYTFIFGSVVMKGMQKAGGYLFVYFSILFLFAYPGQTELWMDGSFNYMWPMVMALILINIYLNDKTYPFSNCLLLFLLSIIFGWTQEGIVIPVAGALFLNLLFDKNYRCKKNYCIVLGYIIGGALIAFSPGTLGRLSTNDAPMHGEFIWLLLSKILNSVSALNRVYIFWISIVAIVFLLFTNRKRLFDNKRLFWFLLWFCNMGFIFLLGFGEERVCLALSVFSTIMLSILYRNALLKWFCNKYMVMFMAVISFVSSIYAVNVIYDYNQYYQNYVQKLHISSAKEVVIGQDLYTDESRFIFIDRIDKDAPERNLFHGKNKIYRLDNAYYNVYLKDIHEPFYVQGRNDFCLYYDNQNEVYYFMSDSFSEDMQLIEYHPKSVPNGIQKIIRDILKSHDIGSSYVEYAKCPKDDKWFVFFKLPENSTVLEFVVEGNKSVYNLI